MTFEMQIRQGEIHGATTINLCRVVTMHTRHQHRAMVVDPIDKIFAALLVTFGLGRDEILSKSREAHIVWPRQIGMALAYETGRFGLMHVGKCFGGCCSSNAFHAIKQVNARCETDKKSRDQYERVKALLA